MSKHLPEYEETKKGHMRNQRQGVRSTKSFQAEHSNNYKRNEVKQKKTDIFIAVHEPKNTMYTNQTGTFLIQSIREEQYQVVPHHIDRNWTLIEKTKRRTEET